MVYENVFAVSLLFFITIKSFQSSSIETLCNSESPVNAITSYACKGYLSANNQVWDSESIILQLKMKQCDSRLVSISILAETYGSDENQNDMLNVAAYTESNSALWSYTRNPDGINKTQYVYIPAPTKRGDSCSVPMKLVMSTQITDVEYTVFVEVKETNIEVGKSMNSTLSNHKAIIYRFNNKNKNEFQQIRIQATRIDVDSFDKVKNGCSILSIQRLDIPFKYNEEDITHRGVWQTMLGLAVIDVNIGPETYFNDGFYIVIQKRSNEQNCKAKDFDFRIDGEKDLYSKNTTALEQDYSTDYDSTIRSDFSEIDEEIKISVSVTSINMDHQKVSWTILTICLILILLSTVISWKCSSISMI